MASFMKSKFDNNFESQMFIVLNWIIVHGPKFFTIHNENKLLTRVI
jgi:hypothetical protein